MSAKNSENWDIKTNLVHAGQWADDTTGSSSVPIFRGSTFNQPDPLNLGKYDYSRSGNPTRDALEECIATLENGAVGAAFASGIASINAALLLFGPGQHLVVGEDIYGGTFRALTMIFAVSPGR